MPAATRSLERRIDGAYAALRWQTDCRPAAAPPIHYSMLAGFDPTHRGIARIEWAGAPPALRVLVPEAGLRPAHDDDRFGLLGSQWTNLQIALDDTAGFADTLRACIPGANPLKFQLRGLLHYHCGIKILKTRQMMVDLQAL